MKEVTQIAWFNHLSSTIGIIILLNEQKEERAYIGTGIGIDEYQDVVLIANYGGKFPLDAAKIIMNEKGQKINYVITHKEE